MSINTDLASKRRKENNLQQNALKMKTNVQTHTQKSAHNPHVIQHSVWSINVGSTRIKLHRGDTSWCIKIIMLAKIQGHHTTHGCHL